ncbi:MAG: class I SAM-dependent methyltransferase [Desulfobacterales bacterium]|nr:class I SAM-dependent methyltransferase [Desulfobacterales bacterium]
MPFKTRDEKEIERINRSQQELFEDIVHVFEPPLPEGVSERLERIVAAAAIQKGEAVLDVGAGTGILVPIIRRYRPGRIIACDLSEKMLDQLRENYSGVETLAADVRDLTLPDASLDAALINACYPNIADKPGAFANLSRMMKAGGRLVVSHPLGKRFIYTLRKTSPFPLDDFPEKSEAKRLLAPYGLALQTFVDDPVLYILAAVKRI